MKDKLTIVKVGGKVVEDADSLSKLLHDFSKIQGYKVLVHGGGRSATQLATQLGIETQMVNGRRVTDADMLRVVTMVYGGFVNKKCGSSIAKYRIECHRIDRRRYGCDTFGKATV
jgi:acetylglutamate kinase